MMEVAAITGHQDPRMLRRYTHLDAADLAESTGLSEQGVGGCRTQLI